jgi:uncharacterized RDD family membrane protein YckC
MKIAEALAARVFDPHETVRAQALAGQPLAAFWQRTAAFAIDMATVLAICIPIEVGWHYLTLKQSGRPAIRMSFDLRELEDLAWVVVYAGISVWWSNGLTVGKRLLGIRVVSLKQERITLWQSVERALGYGASTLEGGFGFIQYFIHHNRQCVHDRIAETIVVKVMKAARQR